MVDDRPHDGKPGGPAVSAENFTDGTVFHGRGEMRHRRGQFPQRILIEPRFLDPVSAVEHVIDHGDARYHLRHDDIDTGHVLSGHRTEIVSASPAHAHVTAFVFEIMSDIFHSVRFAPLSQLTAEIFPPQLRNEVHVGQPQCGTDAGYIVPQSRQHRHQFRHRPVGFFRQSFREILRPAVHPVQLARPHIGHVVVVFPGAVSESRFVGKESGKHIPEIFGEMRINLFMHFIDQMPAGCFRHHRDVMGKHSRLGRIGGHDKINPPESGRQIQRTEPVFHPSGQIDRTAEAFAGSLIPPEHRDLNDFLLRCMFRKDRRARSHRTGHIQHPDKQIPRPEPRVFLPVQGIVRAAGIDMGIVQQPDPHVFFLRLLQNFAEKLQPTLGAEPVPAAVFHDEFPNPGLLQRRHFPFDFSKVFSRIPDQRNNITSRFSRYPILQPF